MKSKKARITCCEDCGNYYYDDDYGCYVCGIDLDEDEMQRFLSGANFSCPYYTNGDEYSIVRKQN